MMRDDELNDYKKKVFAMEYMLTWNATQAAKAIGYKGASARVTGHNLKDDQEVRIYMDYIKDIVQHAHEYTDLIAKEEEVLQTLTRILRREEPNEVANVITEEETVYNDKGRKEQHKAGKIKVTELRTPVADVLSAADKLLRFYAAGTNGDGEEGGVVLLPQTEIEEEEG